MGSNNYTYEMPENFSERIVQLLQQKNKSLVNAFKNCSYDYEDTGWANYKDFKSGVDTWHKKAIILTIRGREQHINLLEKGKLLIQPATSNALQTNITGFLLKDIYYLKSDESASHIGIDDNIERKFVEISNRRASFDKMSQDEKLAELNNLIENLLKTGDSFTELQYSDMCFDYVTDGDVKEYRKQTHCFRHSSKESIQERKNYADSQKAFLIDYGIIIVKAIHLLINKSGEKLI